MTVETYVVGGIGNITSATKNLSMEVRVSDDLANAVGQGSIRTGSSAGARKVVVVDHLAFEDEAESDVSMELVVL